MYRIKEILNRIDSRLFSSLWMFFRDSFHTDEECLGFIYNTLSSEPVNKQSIYHQIDDTNIFADNEGNSFCDEIFYPRRMLNTVNRMVSTARDMDQIRRGKDVFKVVFLITCVETLQQFWGKTGSKATLLFEFFETYTSKEDKDFVRANFRHNDEETEDESADAFKQFVGTLNEYRNCAAHEGDYWNYCFNNNTDKEYPILLICRLDIKNFSSKHKKEHAFETKISYCDFEKIFIRTCIECINQYVASPQYQAARDLTRKISLKSAEEVESK